MNGFRSTAGVDLCGLREGEATLFLPDLPEVVAATTSGSFCQPLDTGTIACWD